MAILLVGLPNDQGRTTNDVFISGF
jgi:hypothetical protein